MSRRRTRTHILEISKFFFYLSIPAMTVFMFNTPEAMQKLLTYNQYVVYPPVVKMPDLGTREQQQQHLDDLRKKRQLEAQEKKAQTGETAVLGQRNSNKEGKPDGTQNGWLSLSWWYGSK